MTGDQTPHITVTYSAFDTEFSYTYAVNEDISRELNQQEPKPAGAALLSWLESKGCRLDSSGGPAVAVRNADSSVVQYFRDGKLHREGGPAVAACYAHGPTEERYYRDGRLHREDGPASINRNADGSMEEEYCRNGKRHRDDGPAHIVRFADGSTVDEYYRNGRFIKTVTAQRPAPKTPDTPGPGPA